MADHLTSDKIEGGYLPVYQRIAADLGPAARVLELGVFEGASMRLWQHLFPQGQVTGVDVSDRNRQLWPDGPRYIIMDQADPALPRVLGHPFDLIVDDASHYGGDVADAFANLWPLTAPGGYYVIEDWMIGLPAFSRHPMYNREILEVMQDLLHLLDTPVSATDEITFRYGLAVVHKRRT